MEIITNFIYQLMFTVGVVVVFGLIIALCRKAFYQILGRKAVKILLITGCIGTPVHELSHALFCLVFGHKIKEIKLYQLNSDDGTLGYVNHTYNPKNLYHRIGNFFIGIAPILCGSGLILFLMFLTVNDLFDGVVAEMWLSEGSDFIGYLRLLWQIVTDIFNFDNISDPLWWLFIILSLMISSHMELSPADIKSGFQGFLFVAGLMLAVDIILYLVAPSALENLTAALTSFGLTIAGFLALSAIFSLFLVVIGLVVKCILKVFKK